MGLVLAMSLFFVIITMIFVAVAVFLPEWMGITGKVAKRVMELQAETKPVEEPQSNPDKTDSKNHEA